MKKNHFFPILCAFALFFTACQKDSDTDPSGSGSGADPRDAFVGTYYLTFSGSCGMGSGSVIVKKGSSANQLLFSDNFMADYPVNLSGSNFSIPTYIQNTVINGYTVSIQVFGNGNFNNGSINYTETSKYGPPQNFICTSQVIGTK